MVSYLTELFLQVLWAGPREHRLRIRESSARRRRVPSAVRADAWLDLSFAHSLAISTLQHNACSKSFPQRDFNIKSKMSLSIIIARSLLKNSIMETGVFTAEMRLQDENTNVHHRLLQV